MRKYGWKRQRNDNRDWMYSSIMRPQQLPLVVDLREHCSDIEDQGEIGSCTANALAGAVEYLEIKNKVKYENVSRLFIYYGEREIENSVELDCGANLRDGIKVLAKHGVCSEEMWPYKIDSFSIKPSEQAFIDAKNHVITSYHSIKTIYEMKQCLYEGFPFVFGFMVYSYFESDEMARTGVLKMPEKSEQCLGGHAVCCVGYDVRKNVFIVRNSWGKEWGQGGYFMMPFGYILDPSLSNDFWTIRKSLNY